MIITDLDKLREKSKDFKGTANDLRDIIHELERELKESKMSGVGLAAIQIGIPMKVAIVRSNKLTLDLVNAEIISASEMIVSKKEGCLSVRKYVDTHRMHKITLKNGDGKIYKLEGFEAIICQHELDHFLGVLITDRSVK